MDGEKGNRDSILAACFARGGKQLIRTTYPARTCKRTLGTWYTRHMAHYELM